MSDVPQAVPHSPKRRRRLLILLAFLALITALVYAFRAVLTPFLVAIFAAYLIDPVVERMAPLPLFRRFHLGRGGAIVILYLVFVVCVYIASAFALPALGTQLRQARDDLPRLQHFAEEQLQVLAQKWAELTGKNKPRETPEGDSPGGAGGGVADPAAPGEGAPARLGRSRLRLRGGSVIEADVLARTDRQLVLRMGDEVQVVAVARLLSEERIGVSADGTIDLKELVQRGITEGVANLDAILRFAFQFGRALVFGLYQVVLIMMITAFLVIDRDAISAFFRSVPPARYRNTYEKWRGYIDRGLAGVIRGQLTICLVNGILTWIGLQFLGVRYSGLLGLIAGIFSLIPIFGTILSTIPIVLIAWGAGDIQKGVLALGWILLIHFLEANFLNPKIMGDASKIHPVVVIFALLAGENAYGIVGALLAVPTASIIQSSFKFYVLDRQTEAPDADDEPDAVPLAT